MGKRITIIVSALVVLGIAFFLITARQKPLHQPAVTAPAVAP
jgi:hypothetical protein